MSKSKTETKYPKQEVIDVLLALGFKETAQHANGGTTWTCGEGEHKTSLYIYADTKLEQIHERIRLQSWRKGCNESSSAAQSILYSIFLDEDLSAESRKMFALIVEHLMDNQGDAETISQIATLFI